MSEDLRAKFRAVLDNPDIDEQEAALDALMHAAGYGTHRCVRCGQQQAKEDDTCPPCDGEIYREEIQHQREELDAKDAQIELLKADRDGWKKRADQADRDAALVTALREDREADEDDLIAERDEAEAERDRLRAAEKRVREIAQQIIDSDCPGGWGYDILAALDQDGSGT